MKLKSILMIAVAVLSMALPGSAQTAPAKTTDQTKSGSPKKAVAATPAPTEKDRRCQGEGHGVGEYHYEGLSQGRRILRQNEER